MFGKNNFDPLRKIIKKNINNTYIRTKIITHNLRKKYEPSKDKANFIML